MATTESGMFQCGSCKKNYKRLDHLARHVRSHTQTKPYKCHICPKAFTRPDLLKRHVGAHDSQKGTVDERSIPETRYIAGRVTQACRACASNHLRCTEEKPCRRCEEKGIECRWNSSMDVDSAYTPPPTGHQEHDPMDERGNGSMAIEALGDLATTSPVIEEQPSLGVFTPQTTHLLQNLEPSLSADPNPLFFDFPDLNLLTGQWAYTGSNDLDMTAYNELDDMDLQFLDSYNISIPFEVSSRFQAAPRGYQTPQDNSHTDPGQPAAMCAEAFQNSHWRFRPNAKDHAGAEEHNLSLPPITADYPSPESRVSLDTDTRVTCAKLGGPARDGILMMVVNSCRSDNLTRALAAFPSAELLDTLLQYYLTSNVTHAGSFIHTASFDPNEKRSELVAAMAASGAWERDNTLVRDLQLLQAFLITLDIGTWSGLPRKVEIAESFFQPILTMMRRDGKFKRSAYPNSKIVDAHGPALKEAWLKWVEMESFKRLAFQLLSHDMNSSMALLVNPLVSYAEVLLPLPCSPDIWTAASPEQWKFISAAQGVSGLLYVADLMDDPDLINNPRASVDTYFAGLAVLSCTWAMCWEYIQFSSFQRTHPRRWNTLVTELRKDELLKLLAHLKLSLASDVSMDPETAMRLELTLLHLHMPFEDIQIFAGMEGPERARAVYPMIRDWMKSEGARHTICHAAQIVQISKRLPKGSVRGPLSITLYHASLAFWAYGLLSDQPQGTPTALNQCVYLDDAEGIALQRFRGFGQGQPCIRGAEDGPGIIPLSQPDKVMEAIMAIVRANFEGIPVPHLTEKLVQLMAELEKSAKRKVTA
ncbi:hypothetical protein ACJ41O_010976 [Fusarium nematophilum]